jgi:uncharacterized protein YbbK (DUF523 family)
MTDPARSSEANRRQGHPGGYHRGMIKILVSSCLLGAKVRWDGGDKKSGHPVLERWVAEGRVVSACPEMLGGLGTPRPPAEIAGGRVVTPEGADVTEAFQRGAQLAADEANANGVRVAILKSASPSCGTGFVYDGTFTRTRVPGDGIATALLRECGVMIFSEEELDAAEAYITSLEAR